MVFELDELLRLVAACLAGAVIGFERELSDKPAGLRTMLLICLGAAVFTLLSEEIAGPHDPGRIAAQIVTGVGFLGAGSIIQQRGSVLGLTTAATIWLVASVGMAFGAGAYVLGAIATVLASLVLFGLGVVEGWVALWRTTAKFQLEFDTADSTSHLDALLASSGLRRKSWRLNKLPEGLTGFLEVVGPEHQITQLHSALMQDDAVRSVRRL